MSAPGGPAGQGAQADVVALTRHRARLARARRQRQGDALLEAPDPEAAVRALPRDEFYYLVAGRGLPEGSEILVHGSPEQIQTVLDFALWDRDRIVPREAERWLAALCEATSERLFEWFRGMDVELAAWLIRQRARIYNLGLELPPDEPEGTFWTTPDGAFEFDLRGDAEAQRITVRLVQALYENDLEYARRVLVGIAAELDSELEETAYRWRCGRMEDLGFADYYEALQVYAPLDPARVRIGEGQPLIEIDADPDDPSLRAPLALADALGEESLFVRAVARLNDPRELAALHGALVLLSNRVLSADRVRPTDDDLVALTLRRVRATLDLGLEQVTQDSDPMRAAEALRTIALPRLFRVGATLIGKVGELASTLVRRHPFVGLPKADRSTSSSSAVGGPRRGLAFFDDEDARVLEHLAQPRPLYPALLDGGAEGAPALRPFAGLAEIARATAAIERAAASLALLGVLGVRPEQLDALPSKACVFAGGVRLPVADALDAGTLARTVLCLDWLSGRPTPLRPLTADEFARLAQPSGAGADRKELPEYALDRLRASVRGRPLSPAEATVAVRWTRSLDPLDALLVETAGDRAPGT